MNAPRLALGDAEVFALRDGFLTVDAGEMFGPRRLGRLGEIFPEAGGGRRAISLNAFLIRIAGCLVLVDTGAGTTVEGPLSASYEFRRDPGLAAGLAALGVGPEDVEIVINTHLHFDHCGGNTVRRADGVVVPAFSRADYVIQRGEWETGLNPPPGESEAYVRETFVPLEEAGRLRLIDGEATVAPGVVVAASPGHTRGHQSVRVESAGRTFVVPGDLIPTSVHVGLSAASGYDLDPRELAVHKRRLLERAAAGGWVLGFVHDPRYPFGKVERPGQRYVFRPVPGAASP